MVAAEEAQAERARRSYRSPLRERRAAETRSAILAAADRFFMTKGWVGTGMRDVATAAGVATETLYGHFSSKRALLQEVVNIALVGDTAPVAETERPEFAAIGRGSHKDRTAAAARVVSEIYGRSAGLAKVIREAAATDEEIADMLRAARERQREDVSRVIELITGRAPTTLQRDGIWALTSPEVYLLLTEDAGWTRDQYEAWMAETLQRIIPPREARTRR
jgi:AcrR family transcriptional regulator